MSYFWVFIQKFYKMNIAQIENNLQNLIKNFSKDTFIFDLLLSYGLPKASITRLQNGNLNLSKVQGEISWKKNETCKARISLRNDVPCWTCIWTSSSAITRSVVQWEHSINTSRALGWFIRNCGDMKMNTVVVVDRQRPWHCSSKW